jgi:hypothetical protein
MGLGYHRLGFFIARLSDGAVAWLLEQFAQVRDKINGVSKHKCWLELVYMASEVAQDTHNSASELRITSDVAGTLRHAPACISTFTHYCTSAHSPGTWMPVKKEETASSILCQDVSIIQR